MNRRQVLTGLAGLTLTGGSLYVAANGLTGKASGISEKVETIDARGSSAGTAVVPTPGEVTVVDLFATWCAPCRAQMDTLAKVHREFGDQASFVSVTNENVGEDLTREDVAAWWRRNHGAWTVGVDSEGDLLRKMGANGIPFTAVTDRNGEITWTHRGISRASAVRKQLREVL